MKKILSTVLAVALLVLAIPFAASANSDVTVTLDGKVIDCNVYGQPATIVEGRTLVPLRAIFEALGASVEWDPVNYVVTSTLDTTTISLKIGENKLYRNGEEVELDVPAMLMNDRTMVPVRAVSESFGVVVEWDNASRTVILLQKRAEIVNPGSGLEKAEDGAIDVLDDYLKAAQAFNLTKLAKYCVDSHGMETLGIANIEQALEKLGFSKQYLSDNMVAETYYGQEDYRPLAEAVAEATYDYIISSTKAMYYKIDGVTVVDDSTTEVVVHYYGPDFDKIEVVFKELFDTALQNAFDNGTVSFGMEQKDIILALVPIIKEELDKAFDATLEKDTFVMTDAEIFTVVKNSNGKWLVELPEDVAEIIEKLKNGTFDGSTINFF